jgi:outer membrane protein
MKNIILTLTAFIFLGIQVDAQKFGYVDSKYILSHIPEYQEAQKQINKMSDTWQKEIEAKYETIEKLDQAEKILLTEDMRQKRSEEIDEKRKEAKELQKQKFGVGGELFQKREELIKPIQEQIYEAIKDVASQSALMVIFDKANQSNMLYTNPKHDVSDKVLRKMGLKPGDVLDEQGGDEEDTEEDSKGGSSGGKQAEGGKTAPKGGEKTSPKGGGK